MPNVLKFEFNKPETVELQTTQTLDVLGNFGAQRLYGLMDGRRMYCDLKLDAQIRKLAPRPGESFTICKHKDPQDARVNVWTVWLTAESERRRAAEEAPLIAEQFAEAMLANVVQMKMAAVPVNEPTVLAPTGTDGPLPQPAPALQLARASGKRQSNVIPFNIAFRETVQFVTKELSAAGEQWSDQAKQDMVSTVLIAASKSGLVGVWER